jgi:S-adenosylmethionine hydrolase
MPPTIALLTDFGTTDTYVGVMKAVMTGICPEARFIDITHAIQPQNVFLGAFTLLNCYRHFPQGTVFLTVVDPGVGSRRRPIAAQAGGYTFVGPDNGLLSFVLGELESPQVVELANPAYQRPPVSYTFHGRDIFAPAAAHLAAGVPLQQFGPPVANISQQMVPALRFMGNEVLGEVLAVDQFGNVTTSIGQFDWMDSDHLRLSPRFGLQRSPHEFTADCIIVRAGGQTLTGVKHTYAETKRSELLALIGSDGYLEIAVNQGSAADHLKLAPGAPVSIEGS